MRRVAAALGALLVAAVLLVPVAFGADGSLAHTGRVLFAAEDSITVPSGQRADTIFVVRGTATIQGEANTVVVIDGRAVIDGGTTESIVAINSPVDLMTGAVVRGDIFKLESLVTKHGDAELLGQQRDIAGELAGVGFFLGPLFFLLYIGFALAAIAAGLLLAGLAARQVRAAEAMISTQPGTTFLVGLGAVVVPILVIAMLFVSVVGVPLALGILLGLWPFTAFLGYLVAGIWIGDWLLRRMAARPVERERPYLAAVIGLLVLQALALLPFLSGIAGIFGLGAVVRLAYRTLRSGHVPGEAVQIAVPAPQPG